jgi:YVTN family beta-propeller protein
MSAGRCFFAGNYRLANLGDGTVSVISGRTGTVTGTIPVGTGPRGVAVNPVTNTVYVANFFDNTVSVISR